MADNVTIPAQGVGDSTPDVATDDVSGVHYQKVKLVDGTADSSTVIPGTGDGIYVKTFSTVIDLTLSLDTSIYSDGYVLAAVQELASAVRSSIWAICHGQLLSFHLDNLAIWQARITTTCWSPGWRVNTIRCCGRGNKLRVRQRGDWS